MPQGQLQETEGQQDVIRRSSSTMLAMMNAGPDLQPRPLTDSEREEAWTRANFFNASSNQEPPIALWILGPSSVGKSSLTAQVGPSFGIPRRGESSEEPSDERQALDAVLVDGEFMRDAHAVWHRWIRSPDWRLAYPAMKATINAEKDHMCAEAVKDGKHIIVPQTALNLQKALEELRKLESCGYTNHVLAVVAPLEECQRRGSTREAETGKRYQPAEFHKSIEAIVPILAAANGRYAVVRALENSRREDGMRCQLLAQGLAGDKDAHLDLAHLQEILDAAIAPADVASEVDENRFAEISSLLGDRKAVDSPIALVSPIGGGG